MRTDHLTCKACAKPFERVACAGQKPGYCSFRCEHDARMKRKRDSRRERYRAMRLAGIEPFRARLAATGRHNTERLLAEARALREAEHGSAAE